MDGAVAVLAEEDLVDVGIHEIGLAEMRGERHRHDGLAHLAPERLPGGEEVALHELLGQRAAALLDPARAQIDPERPQHGERIDAVVGIEVPVLHRLQRRRQKRRHLLPA